MKMRKGEITAYLSLILILLAAFAGSMLEGASIQIAKNYRRADMNLAVECIFAEYQKELLEDFDIFALEGSYETGIYSEEKMLERLTYYGAGNMEQNIRKIQFLTDRGCQSFYEQAIAYMKHKYGLDQAKEYIGKTDLWRQQEEEAAAYKKTEAEKQQQLSELLEENQGELPGGENPIAHVEQLKNTPILTLVMPEDIQLSSKRLELSDTVSHRKLNRGYGDFPDMPDYGGTVSSLLFGEYVLEHFSMVTDRGKTGVLDYQVEYILGGRDSDKENLEAVVNKLLLIRFVPNYTYLRTDSVLRAEAKAAAITLCSLMAVPAAAEAAEQVLLLSWAYGESIMDVRALLKGNRVPITKSGESWQLQLSSLLKLGTQEDHSDGADTEGGLSYKEYLRMLLFLEKQDFLSMRALDLIEQRLKIEKGQRFFCADQCISRVEISSRCSFRRGITYEFSTYFGYN